ncbi:putative pre-mRNA-splicing factor ATP-dependent RNA helicase DEAH6 [Glycine soja]|uniref:Putative pre-mRNA-splicing factor ATP-dependent RNA helicase DEAH6 n=1 Tax=Glycine soja TaxID=3848 RepID=A0A445H709_GLYSO|nr:putative pre-mRNA-splicing factor ATP-dependent RNA helicase DEAH6 [Glycine soja]
MLYLMVGILGFTNDLSVALQKRDQDLLNALSLVKATKEELQEMRNDGWKELISKVMEICNKHDIDVPDLDALLKTWVSDKLMPLLGYSQPTVVQFVIGLSKQATSPAHLVGKLVEFGISSMDAHAFAEEIYSRVPRRSSGINQYQKQEREAAMLARKQKTYSILKADDDSDDDYVDKSSVTTASSRRSDNHKKRFRKKTEVQDDQDDEAMCS